MINSIIKNKYTTIALCLFVTAFLMFSCEKKLFKENEEKYILVANEQEAVDLLNGVYNRLAEVHNGDYLMALSRSDDINIYYGYEYTFGSPFDIINPTCMGSTDHPENASGDIYVNLYVAIANTNRLIQNLTKSGNNTLLGESYFLRAYCYFKLARWFGKPPLVIDIDIKYLIEKPTYREVYELIEKDMLKALELLPETYTFARVPGETPHKGTARAVLAEIYLAMAGYPVNDISKYAEAACLAGEVIKEAEYYNYGLLDDMADLWKKEFRHNKENIFGLFFTEKSSNQNTINIKPLPSSNPNVTFFSMDTYHPGMKFFMDFPNQYRKEVSFLTIFGKPILEPFSWYYEIHDPTEYPCMFIEYCLSKKNKETKISFDSSSFEFDQAPGKNTVTLYLFRYAHTLLTYAEAKTRAGQMDETCYEAVNKIRRRANKLDINTPSEYDLSPGLTSEQFLDSVVWERAWELCLEPEGRWFDMVRLDLKNKLSEYFLPSDQYVTLDRSYFTQDWYFYLIPKEDRLINPNF